MSSIERRFDCVPARRGVVVVLWIALAAMLGACAAPSWPLRDGFESNATRLFAAGYEDIAERYLEPVSIADTALAGMAGLSAIDSDIAVRWSGPEVQLSRGGTVLAAFRTPDARDARGWAALTANAIVVGRSDSAPLRATKDEAVFQAVFDAAVKKLDPYTRYLGPDGAKEERARRIGFGGIGVRLHTVEGRHEVLSIMPATPAAAAGLRPKDRIQRIDDVPVAGLELREIVERLRGPPGAELSITVERPDPPGTYTFRLVREKIVAQTVTAETEGGLLSLKISNFNRDTAKTVQQNVAEARRRQGSALAGLILDLRDNPGGLLDQAVRVADLFLKKGAIISTRGRHPDSMQAFDASGSDISGGLPIVLLVNGATASSAEVLAAALQDNGRAVAVGTATYGKGSVQTVMQLPNDGELIVTWSRLHAPSGYALHGLGVLPAVCTSGMTGPAPAVLEEMRRKSPDTRALLRNWHAMAHADADAADRLRSACRPDKADRALDPDVARALLADGQSYRQAAMLSVPELAGQ